ncbi:MAG: mechanosensitive ion channel family protein [Candidatus Cyclonatronum sp.]|uniref:mechanosensitive ion channel family protein n=1 Tax=Cyclonatronum sp. TaxID=3024185 RepID=UPI0025C5275B|nr:mechanosensitive ion channel domain-containing protein [Cyclonatronum sp.]MCC5934791.1 mechanosensitive ion channel [Balneolales bacterium]MCH8486814.1 mechanosensitive ion channel family protein [Cyclonatronum sp.]
MIPQQFRQIAQQVSDYLGTSVGISENLLHSLLVILVLLLLRYVFIALVYWKSKSPAVHYNFKRLSTQAFFVIGIFLIGKIWFEGFQSIATFLGLLSVGLALALRELLTDLAGWIYIIVRQPFEMGDRIEVAGVKGDVIDKRLFTFSVIEIGNRVDAEQSTGRIIHIPNSKVFSDPVANYTSGFPFIWHELPVTITYDSNHRKARELFAQVLEKHAEIYVHEAQQALVQAQENFMLKFSILTPAVFVTVRENGILLTARYLCPVRKTRSTEQAISLDLLEKFSAEPDIRYAFSTVRLHDQRGGKEA